MRFKHRNYVQPIIVLFNRNLGLYANIYTESGGEKMMHCVAVIKYIFIFMFFCSFCFRLLSYFGRAIGKK